MVTRRAALLGVAAAVFLGGCTTQEIPDLYGVRLGMSPRDVRDRFSPTGGTWKSDALGDDYSISWEAPTPARPGDPLQAKFEFHMGILVAVRARVPSSAALAQGAEYAVTKGAVLRRVEAATHETDLDLLARDCPTHHDEAQAFVTASGKH